MRSCVTIRHVSCSHVREIHVLQSSDPRLAERDWNPGYGTRAVLNHAGSM